MKWGSLDTPVGRIGVGVDEAAVRWCGWPGRSPTVSVPEPVEDIAAEDRSLLGETLRQLSDYFAGTRTAFDLPVDLSRLEPTTQRVLHTLADTVTYGETITYGELAVRSGSGLVPRGIGAMMGANPVPLIVACHRVLASDGLGGFSGGDPGKGRETKIWLLEHEGALPPSLW